jgi:hypothetical protein
MAKRPFVAKKRHTECRRRRKKEVAQTGRRVLIVEQKQIARRIETKAGLDRD